jgi:hypothetical protein
MAIRKPPDDETIRVAPEASQGAWRERAFTPRAVMPHPEIVEALERSLRVMMTSASHPRAAYDGLRRAWWPTLRQVVEQFGGDGLDAWLGGLLTAPGKPPADPLFDDLVAALQRMRSARDVALLEEEALKAIELVRRSGRAGPRPLSFRVLERELEGKLEVDELLLAAAAPADELRRRVVEIGTTMEQLRDQLTSQPGPQPEGMYASFVRLKAELRVVDAELNRRSATRRDRTPLI